MYLDWKYTFRSHLCVNHIENHETTWVHWDSGDLWNLKTPIKTISTFSPIYYPLLASTVLWYVSLFIEQLFVDCPGHNCEPIRKVLCSHHTCTLYIEEYRRQCFNNDMRLKSLLYWQDWMQNNEKKETYCFVHDGLRGWYQAENCSVKEATERKYKWDGWV